MINILQFYITIIICVTIVLISLIVAIFGYLSERKTEYFDNKIIQEFREYLESLKKDSAEK